MTKHTPGPWVANFSSEGIFSIMKIMPSKQYPDTPNIFDIQTICPIKPFEKLTKEYEANGKLIAAAPELLEALQGLIERNEIMSSTTELKKLIKKATE